MLETRNRRRRSARAFDFWYQLWWAMTQQWYLSVRYFYSHTPIL